MVVSCLMEVGAGFKPALTNARFDVLITEIFP